ncbi:uncharacterized mitochondrial protein AtMg00860-like [Henckelia pumila]|uniref:uncharacterized mitochondrial protein AtMg00860-like n=1 Tax=Henckelia pumila TaxID=405737 RepID=UPI003C6E9844
MCIDCWDINKITVRYRFPIPRIEDLLDQLCGAMVFRKLDLKSAYHQMRTRPVLFLGYVVSSAGLQVDHSKISMICDWSCPQSLVDVHSFHGLTSFYRRFIPQFSSVMASITDCLRQGQFLWTNAATLTFEDIKDRLTSALIFVLPDFSKTFELHCNAFKMGISDFLSQLDRSIAYFSEKLQGPRVRYNTYDI